MANNRSEVIDKLDRLGEEWCAGQGSMSADQRIRMAEEVFLTIDKLLPPDSRSREALSGFFISDWPKFSAEKGKLSVFLASRLKLRLRDLDHWERGDRRLTVHDPDTGKEKRKWTTGKDSLDRSIDPEDPDSGTLMDLAAYDSAAAGTDAPDRDLQLDTIMLQVIPLILELHQRLKGRANNPQRIRYYRMFFTDSSVDIMQNHERIQAYIAHERDLFQAMYLGFLDYFMKDRCRTVREVCKSSVKLLGELIPGAEMKNAGHPLPSDVYLNYLKTVEGIDTGTRSMVSENRNHYRDFLRENGVC